VLPIKSWRIHYADGSVFSSRDGSWAEAPSFGVVCVVYYHVPPYKTVDTVKSGIYTYLGDIDGEPYKMGLWLDDEGYYRVISEAGSFPEVD
jgi:hypothetical protein